MVACRKVFKIVKQLCGGLKNNITNQITNFFDVLCFVRDTVNMNWYKHVQGFMDFKHRNTFYRNIILKRQVSTHVWFSKVVTNIRGYLGTYKSRFFN